MFYQVDRQMNNLLWITEAFFERKADATRYINCKTKEGEQQGLNYIKYLTQERQFSKLKDFNFKK